MIPPYATSVIDNNLGIVFYLGMRCTSVRYFDTAIPCIFLSTEMKAKTLKEIAHAHSRLPPNHIL